MIPYTDKESGLRDYRPNVANHELTSWPRWPWLVLLAFFLGLAIGSHR